MAESVLMSALRGRRCSEMVQNVAVAAAADGDRRAPRVTVSTPLLAVFTFKQEARGGGTRKEEIVGQRSREKRRRR